jgi:hypothetical protein
LATVPLRRLDGWVDLELIVRVEVTHGVAQFVAALQILDQPIVQSGRTAGSLLACPN